MKKLFKFGFRNSVILSFEGNLHTGATSKGPGTCILFLFVGFDLSNHGDLSVTVLGEMFDKN